MLISYDIMSLHPSNNFYLVHGILKVWWKALVEITKTLMLIYNCSASSRSLHQERKENLNTSIILFFTYALCREN